MTIQKQFADNVTEVVKNDEKLIGLAVAGSWLRNEIDEFSDLDLILVTQEKITGDRLKMLNYAKQFGNFLSGFTGEHVGEPRVLICLFDNPLLHVDIKFITLAELSERIDTPVILLDKDGQIKRMLEQTEAKFPYPDYQWIEDRFWIWAHYALLKIGRGEFVEAFDFFGFLRMVVFGPLMHIKNDNLPRGVRKVEKELASEDLEQVLKTLPKYSGPALLNTLQHCVTLYRQLRQVLFSSEVSLQLETEQKVLEYFQQIKSRYDGNLCNV